MRKLCQPKHCSILGIDITSTSVKVLEISSQGELFCVERYGRALLPPHALDGRSIKDSDAVTYCLKKILFSLNSPCKKVALAVPDSAVVSKIVQINSILTEREIEEFLASEVDKYIAYPAHEMNFDFQVLGRSAVDDALSDVLIVASKKECLEQRMRVITRAGLDVVVVDTESYALERAAQWVMHDSVPQEKIAILDIGANNTQLFILYASRLIYSREEKFGTGAFMMSLAEHHQLSVEQLIHHFNEGMISTEFEANILTPLRESILWQTRRALQFFYSADPGESVDKLVLAGGFAMIPNLVCYLEEQEGIPVSIANPFACMTLGSMINRDILTHDASALMVACGLALRSRG